MTRDSLTSFDKQRSNACELGCLEYPLLACARDDADPGYVYEASTDDDLVAEPAGQLSYCINQSGYAVTECDTPARRPGHIDVDEPAGAGTSAHGVTDYQAVRRSVDPEGSDQPGL
jgi:hypothetical protein